MLSLSSWISVSEFPCSLSCAPFLRPYCKRGNFFAKYQLFSTTSGNKKTPAIKRGEIRKQAKSLKSSRLWTAGKQVTTE